jgi:aminopeptidase N
MSENKTIHLKDYKVHPYKVVKIDLEFDLLESKTKVYAKIQMEAQVDDLPSEFSLDGEQLKLLSVKFDGEELGSKEYRVDSTSLIIRKSARKFILETVCEINPEINKSCEGLYLSDGSFCTQCEAQGFRKITYYMDRPDNMAVFTTKIIADKKKYPVLLSNGNKVDSGDLPEGRHFALWSDPHKKPSYLFAVVAGDLGLITDKFTTRSGREVALEIFVDKGNEDQCAHAMRSLKNCMKWDEDVFGLEYDLDIYMIVAVDAFNMGAMENKGLNVFNSAYVLAKQETATDTDFQGIEGVIGHEYFHNWTGNRVTCRDWFQLTLKEGLTVFRDQEFSADMVNRSVKRIEDVKGLRQHQFSEDAGPLSHPIRPSSYIEINNFYTSTIYEKGSEVIRMIHTLVGAKNFRAGIDKYFELFDGQAVTTEDFVYAMELASGKDLAQFKRWYSQNGTPTLNVSSEYVESESKYILTLKQTLIESENNKGIGALHIPFKVALFDTEGNELNVADESGAMGKEFLLEIRDEEVSYTFKNVQSAPILSMNRGFTAPVIVNYEYSNKELATLMGTDTDDFNRYEAGQILMEKTLFDYRSQIAKGEKPSLETGFKSAYKELLTSAKSNAAFFTFALQLPAEASLNEKLAIFDIDGVHSSREALKTDLANEYSEEFFALYTALNVSEKFSVDSEAMGRRDLKNFALTMLTLNTNPSEDLVYKHLANATNMTDEICALNLICQFQDCDRKTQAIKSFEVKWKNESLVINKWLKAQSGVDDKNIIDKLIKLETHELFDKNNPNKLRALYGPFSANLSRFHAKDGSGYRFMVDKLIEIDAYNPQVASRLINVFGKINQIDTFRQELMRGELKRIAQNTKTSKDVLEKVTKYLE